MERAVPSEIFRNRRTTFRGVPLFPFQPVGAETYRSIYITARFFPVVSSVRLWADAHWLSSKLVLL